MRAAVVRRRLDAEDAARRDRDDVDDPKQIDAMPRRRESHELLDDLRDVAARFAFLERVRCRRELRLLGLLGRWLLIRHRFTFPLASISANATGNSVLPTP